MVDTGWIKVHRKMLHNGFFKRSQYVHLWLCILLKANHDKTEFMWNGKVEKLMPGQLVTGRKKLSEETGISESTIEDILKFLERQQQIQQQKTNKYRLLTVINWSEYQGNQQQKQQQGNNKATTRQQPADTFKNEKNVKNEKNKDIVVFSEHLLNSLRIPLSDKAQTENLIKTFGLDEMIKIIDRMAIYFNTCKENKWNKYIIGKHWRNLYQKIEYFSSDESLQNKLSEMERANIKPKPDCRTVSADFSSDMELMKKQMAAVNQNTVIEEIKHD